MSWEPLRVLSPGCGCAQGNGVSDPGWHRFILATGKTSGDRAGAGGPAVDKWTPSVTVQTEEWGLCAGLGCGAHWSLREEPADRMGWMCGEGCGDPWADGVTADWEREGRRRRRAGDASLLLA